MASQLWYHPFQEGFRTLLEEASPLALQPKFTAQGRAEDLIQLLFTCLPFPERLCVILGVSQYTLLGRHKGEAQEMFKEQMNQPGAG